MQEMQETWVWSLGKEDTLEEEMATCSSILAWRIPWTEEPGRVTVRKVTKELDTTERLKQQYLCILHWSFDIVLDIDYLVFFVITLHVDSILFFK